MRWLHIGSKGTALPTHVDTNSPSGHVCARAEGGIFSGQDFIC